jgi:metal-responsive CopG/Arc/MetJ family transcriptional regulator
MANVKTAISLQESLFEQIDKLAQEMKVPRSRLFVLALEDYLHRHRSQRLLTSINEAYQEPLGATEQKRLHKMQRHYRKVVDEW